MPIKYIPYIPNTVEGQAVLNNIVRTRRLLRYRDNDKIFDRIKRGLPLYEVEKVESVGNNPKNLLIRGECLSACAYLKDQGIEVDLVYVDPPFASGADYAKKVFIRRNPKLAEKIKKAEEELEIEELRAFEEKMYGDIWNKENYLNWMYENLVAIKSVMSNTASIYVHLDWHIGHYVKVLMDEVFAESNFVNEIVWGYKDIGAKAVPYFKKKHDTIFMYQKSEKRIFNIQRQELSESTIERFGSYFDENGVITYKWLKDNNPGVFKKLKGIPENLNQPWLDKNNGQPLADWWDDISPLKSHFDEAVDYNTQKPEALLERIIRASSNKDMIVADLFGGSGVASVVANREERTFIHVDVGINSIHTTRDRLIAEKAEFDILEIKDGVSLFRNPVQTMDKLKSLITGLKNEDSLDSFWEGAIQDSKLGMVPVYVPNLLDHSTKVLDIPLMNRVLNEAMPDLPDGVKQVIVYYVDIDDEKALSKFIAEYNPTEIKVELRDLKEILDEVVVNDIVEYELIQTDGGHKIEFNKFISDRLMQKIDEYNQKKGLSEQNKALFNGDTEENDIEEAEEQGEEGEGKSKKKKFTPIKISDVGLELIELISLDCTNTEGIWKSDNEIKIDKNGFVIHNGVKTKEFWNGTITCEKKPLRMKLRNIASDESIIALENIDSLTHQKSKGKTKPKTKEKSISSAVLKATQKRKSKLLKF